MSTQNSKHVPAYLILVKSHFKVFYVDTLYLIPVEHAINNKALILNFISAFEQYPTYF